MTLFNPLITALYQIGAIKFGEFTLKSGLSSKIYLDLRQIVSHPQMLRNVSSAIWKKIHTCHADLLCGVPYTALPIATCLSLQHDIPMVMRRKEQKGHGTKQQIEGKIQPGQRCLVIEDVITTGGSILETAADLKAAELEVKDVAVLIDRQQGGAENLMKKNFNLHVVFTLQEIMQNLLHSTILPLAEREIVKNLIQEQN